MKHWFWEAELGHKVHCAADSLEAPVGSGAELRSRVADFFPALGPNPHRGAC